MTNELSPQGTNIVIPGWTETPQGYTLHRYYDGVMYGWINFLRDERDGTCWSLFGGQWRYWDEFNRTWQYFGVRQHNRRSNTYAGFIMGLLGLLFGVIFPAVAPLGEVGDWLQVGGVIWFFFCWFLGMANDYVANHHPQAYEGVALVSAAMGAYAVASLTSHARHHEAKPSVREYSEPWARNEIGR